MTSNSSTQGIISYLLFFLFILCAASANADRVILKDGTVEESDRVWITDRYVHFILQGTKSVEIRYVKEIVARIEHQGVEQPVDATPPREGVEQPVDVTPPQVPDEPVRESLPSTKPKPPTPRDVDKPSEPQKSSTAEVNIDRRAIENNRGAKFYDPHRPQRYWATRISRHNSVTAAIGALSQIYGRSPSWIENHMGEENDLGLIHKSLITACEKDKTSKEDEIQKEKQEEDSSNNGAKSLQHQAETSPTPLTVDKTKASSAKKDNETGDKSGESGVGGRNLSNAPHHSTLPPGYVPKGNFPEIPKGIQFYDPRRAQKYWTDESHRFNSLNDALKALADDYGVSEDWIGDHLGKTNDLYQIHQSIRQSLTSE